jgi:hypothetical protein
MACNGNPARSLILAELKAREIELSACDTIDTDAEPFTTLTRANERSWITLQIARLEREIAQARAAEQGEATRARLTEEFKQKQAARRTT